VFTFRLNPADVANVTFLLGSLISIDHFSNRLNERFGFRFFVNAVSLHLIDIDRRTQSLSRVVAILVTSGRFLIVEEH
jgi:hypothetical protein